LRGGSGGLLLGRESLRAHRGVDLISDAPMTVIEVKPHRWAGKFSRLRGEPVFPDKGDAIRIRQRDPEAAQLPPERGVLLNEVKDVDTT
jgi:hypothetical protein